MTTAERALVCVMLLSAAACGGSATRDALAEGGVQAAVAAYQADPARELRDLKLIAERVLVTEARASDATQSVRAWSLLRGLGPNAQDAWAELEREPGDHNAQLVRTHALAFHSQLGDGTARRKLRAFEESARASEGAGIDPERIALALEALDPERDLDALRGWARSTAAVVRGAAVVQLAGAPASHETRALLGELARSEPDESVRLLAIRALGAQGKGAWASLEALARSEPLAVRGAAIAALLELDAIRAEPLCAAALSDAPSMLGVEVAQAVLLRAQRGLRSDSLEATAEHQILAALAAPKPDLRGRAASAALAVAASPDRAALQRELALRLTAERDRRVHVLLALALRDHPAAKQALQQLASGRDVPAAQAAAELATRRDPKALPRLRALAKSKEVSVRVTASAALARAYDFELTSRAQVASVQALLDPDTRVRTATAVALLQSIGRLKAGP